MRGAVGAGAPQRQAMAPAALRTDWLRLWSLVSMVAGLLAAVVRLTTPFEHGVWLVAYLLLVGSLAAYLLAAGEAALVKCQEAARGADAQAAMWAFGTIAVPVGVLGETRLAVVSGSAALLMALASMATTGRPLLARRLPPREQALSWAYAALLVFMTISVAVGLALAWDLPWI